MSFETEKVKTTNDPQLPFFAKSILVALDSTNGLYLKQLNPK